MIHYEPIFRQNVVIARVVVAANDQQIERRRRRRMRQSRIHPFDHPVWRYSEYEDSARRQWGWEDYYGLKNLFGMFCFWLVEECWVCEDTGNEDCVCGFVGSIRAVWEK